jgi:hypothetical protein
MIYLDTSTLVPLFVREPTSEAVRQQLSTLPANELTISEWTKAEFVSAVGIRARTGHLDPQVGSGIVQALYEMADRSLLVLAPETGDFVMPPVIVNNSTWPCVLAMHCISPSPRTAGRECCIRWTGGWWSVHEGRKSRHGFWFDTFDRWFSVVIGHPGAQSPLSIPTANRLIAQSPDGRLSRSPDTSPSSLRARLSLQAILCGSR